MPLQYEVNQIADGWSGTDSTVSKIESLVNASLLDPLVVTTAQGIVRNLPERDIDGEIASISRFVKAKIRYTAETVETLKTPRLLLDEIQRYGRATGDCDDHVILWGALNRAIGHKVRFKVVSQRKDKIASHIYGEVYSPKQGWISDELIVKNRELGWHIPQHQVTEEKTYQMGEAYMQVGEVGRRHRVARPDLVGWSQSYSGRWVRPAPSSSGIGGTKMSKMFQPGGTRRYLSNPNRGCRCVTTPSLIAASYMKKPGSGMLSVGPDGIHGMGAFELPDLFGAAGAALIGKYLGPKVNPVPGTYTPPPPSSGGMSTTTMALLGGGALLVAFLVMKK